MKRATQAPSTIERRTLVAAAAWSAPVVAAAVAAPLAAASAGTATVQWSGGAARLLELELLSGGLLEVSLLPSAPTVFSIANSTGVVPAGTATFSVAQNTTALGIDLGSLLSDVRLRGFAPSSIPVPRGSAIRQSPSAASVG